MRCKWKRPEQQSSHGSVRAGSDLCIVITGSGWKIKLCTLTCQTLALLHLDEQRLQMVCCFDIFVRNKHRATQTLTLFASGKCCTKNIQALSEVKVFKFAHMPQQIHCGLWRHWEACYLNSVSIKLIGLQCIQMGKLVLSTF